MHLAALSVHLCPSAQSLPPELEPVLPCHAFVSLFGASVSVIVQLATKLPGGLQEYCSAQSDPLRGSAAALAGHLNAERGEDVLRIAAEAVGLRFEALTGAQLLCAPPASGHLALCAHSHLPEFMNELDFTLARNRTRLLAMMQHKHYKAR